MWGLPGGVKKGVVEKSDASESKGLKCGGKVAKLLANCFYFANAFDFRGDWYLPTNKNRNETRMLSFPTLCHKKMLA